MGMGILYADVTKMKDRKIKKAKKADTNNKVRRIEHLDDSALMQQLKELSDSDREILRLHSNVQQIAGKAANLLGTVVKDMPLYTLHNERHILNVIVWMESLLGDGIQELSPLECGLCILAAYTHDLGMTLSSEESAELAKNADYIRFRDRFLDERQSIEQLGKQGNHYRAQLLENHLRTEYLRSTHADKRAERLRRRLKEMASEDELTYRGFDFRSQLELVAISHNQPVEWLRLKFEKQKLRWDDTVGDNEQVHFAVTGILLRLADIMDFDASRTPRILFRHLGLDGELASRFEKLSSQEWNKHLAITGIEWRSGDDPLTYRAPTVPIPWWKEAFTTLLGSFRKRSAMPRARCGTSARICASASDCPNR
jgi:molecular chaperone HtpG